MGELADDMINGFSCSWCGIYFREEHGYPISCNSCWQDVLKETKEKNYEIKKDKNGKVFMINGVQKAIYKEL